MTSSVHTSRTRLSVVTPTSSFMVAGTTSRPRGMTLVKKLVKTDVEMKMGTRKETARGTPGCSCRTSVPWAPPGKS